MLNRRDFVRACGAGVAGAAGAAWLGRLARAQTAAGRTAARPNIVLILADDLGRQDVGCYGSTFYETPHIDRLARQGMLFSDAYAACPVCSPTRASIMTGKYPARLHVTDFIAGRLFPHQRLVVPRWTEHLALEETTIAEQFRQAGYATAMIGKWHLGGAEFAPEKQGFDLNIGGTHSGSPRSYFAPYGNKKLPDGPRGENLTDRLAREAVGFIDRHRDRPFFLYLSLYAVHTPIQGKPDLTQKYQRKMEAQGIQRNPGYAAMVETMDQAVGTVVQRLDELKLSENTVVVFFSDNGGLVNDEGRPVTTNTPLREGKGWLYEGGIREPMIVRWPGVVQPGSRCSAPVISNDLYPTLLDIAGVTAAPDPDRQADSASFAGLAKSAGSGALNRPAIYWHYPHYNYQGAPPGGAVRAGDYKLIEYYEDSRVELYNLRDDLGETKDLAAALPDKAAELRKMLHDWRQSVGAQMPRPNPDYDPDDPTRDSKWGRQVP